MNVIENNSETILDELIKDSKLDYLRMMKSAAKSVLTGFEPSNFKDVYLSISREQGEELRKLIVQRNIKNVVEFGTSFGISTLFLAQGVTETNGKIITTELIPSKAKKAKENFERAGVAQSIEVLIGDAMDTLKNHSETIDLLLLDGWKDLYHPLFKMLEPNFHNGTIIYVDNADMAETRDFLSKVKSTDKYELQSQFGGKVVLITSKIQE
ncbi:O-methyltransferase [Croceivirga thetidis]|uniref:Methyltransferase n=1 Tax=Croceivirga thetidis TaxID=2721623 RepID=A0ABX1GUM7_9FLAO|nr:class I SAM-dependent methyltransferase [Croceivirga thetidis]NKI32736.1 hypothetical protein [Croceivirga thetidis]